MQGGGEIWKKKVKGIQEETLYADRHKIQIYEKHNEKFRLTSTVYSVCSIVQDPALERSSLILMLANIICPATDTFSSYAVTAD
jgi:hypothetical protein